MEPGTTKSCRFMATDAGGWWSGFAGNPVAGYNTSEPSTHVLVSSASGSSNYSSMTSTQPTVMDMSGFGCDDSVIQPGDLVEVDVTAGGGYSPGSYYEGGAGRGWSCSGHP